MMRTNINPSSVFESFQTISSCDDHKFDIEFERIEENEVDRVCHVRSSDVRFSLIMDGYQWNIC